jgi:small subunit ribosomal protein S8
MDSVADMLNSINTAQAVLKEQISVPYSNFKFAILEALKKQGYIKDVQKKGRAPKKRILIDLKYKEGDVPAISKIRKISKQGQRIYASASELKPVKSGYGISIISTPKGILTNKEARKEKVGGEIICELW